MEARFDHVAVLSHNPTQNATSYEGLLGPRVLPHPRPRKAG